MPVRAQFNRYAGHTSGLRSVFNGLQPRSTTALVSVRELARAPWEKRTFEKPILQTLSELRGVAPTTSAFELTPSESALKLEASVESVGRLIDERWRRARQRRSSCRFSTATGGWAMKSWCHLAAKGDARACAARPSGAALNSRTLSFTPPIDLVALPSLEGTLLCIQIARP